MDPYLPVICTVKVIYAYLAREEGDLTLRKGDIIKVHDNEGGWWRGSLLPDYIVGNFPSNFVEIMYVSLWAKPLRGTDTENIPTHCSFSIIYANRNTEEPNEIQISPARRNAHLRQNSIDTSKFTKRKPVSNIQSPTNATSTTPSHILPSSTNLSNVSLAIAASRKNPQAIIGDMNQFEEPDPSSSSSEPSSPQQQIVNRRYSQGSPKSTRPRSSPIASHITGINSPTSSTDSSSAKENVDQEYRETALKQMIPLPGAFPTPVKDSFVQENSMDDTRERFNQTLLNPTTPTSLTIAQIANGRQLQNRSSMPNLTCEHAQQPCPSQNLCNNSSSTDLNTTNNTGMLPPGRIYMQENTNGSHPSTLRTQSTYCLSHGNKSGVSFIENNATSKASCIHSEQYHTEDPQQLQSGIIPRCTTEYYNQQIQATGLCNFSAGTPSSAQQPTYRHNDNDNNGVPSNQQLRLHRHSIANFRANQQTCSQEHSPTLHSDLSLENLAKHNRTQSVLGAPPSHAFQGSRHGRSRSQAKSAPMNRLSFIPRPSSPSIVIPQPRPRPRSALASYGTMASSPSESSPTSSTSTSSPYRSTNSPSTPCTAESSGRGTPTSICTTMSAVSASGAVFGPREIRKKSETARMPPSTPMASSTFTARKFSVDARTALAGSNTTSIFMPSNFSSAPTTFSDVGTISSFTNSDRDFSMYTEDTDDHSSESLGTYTAKKPKATLIRAFKQIINPRKVAEKDAVREKREHFAWIEMQKSLKRVPSPEIGKERSFFASDESLPDDLHDQDPFEVLKKCQVIRDTVPLLGSNSNSLLEFGPTTFIQVDKVARNVNQRGTYMTPQLLSQKYLTRPYSKSPLFKLRVLFVWISENIRLEGGTARDVSGGRYKLGPGSDTLSSNSTVGDSPSLRSSSNVGAGSPSSSAAGWTTESDEHSRSLLHEDTPELAQEVLTSRTCKTGEGFANLFAEMALAAGIEDVGVVKGYIKGPMDVFSKDIPAANHAWNVVRINGTYRFIDCCLASPFHPAHYPNRPQTASSFYFLTSPMDLIMSHFPVFLTYQYITPSIPPQIFLRLPFVRPAFFDFGLSLPEFKRRTRLDIKDDESVEVIIRIDGGGGMRSGSGAGTAGGGCTGGQNGVASVTSGLISSTFGGECLGRGCGEGVELRAEVEAMTADGKVIKKRALAQIMIWNPYQAQLAVMTTQAQQAHSVGPASSSLSMSGHTGAVESAGQHPPSHHRQLMAHHCTGIRIAKIKAVLPSEAVVGAGGVRKGVVHIYAGRKVENAPTDATPYSLALTLPIRHTGTMPKTPFNFVLPHFSPYEFYVKSPQSEVLYHPHIYKFSVVSLAAQSQAATISANAAAIAENDAAVAMAVLATNSSSNMGGTIGSNSGNTILSRHLKTSSDSGSLTGSVSMNTAPLYRPSPNAQQSKRNAFYPSNGPSGSLATNMTGSSAASMLNPPGHSNGTIRAKSSGGQQRSQYHVNPSISMVSTSSNSINGVPSNMNGSGGVAIPRPERLVLRTQTNRIYKLVYDPVRQCHEAHVEVKERGIWECVRMDDGGKSRVGREGTGGVVIASWKCV
ncbi:cytokinesis protein 3 [Linnemannia zychae]|nr:cytokinesis protein 3 [Linnemannia zychae]